MSRIRPRKDETSEEYDIRFIKDRLNKSIEKKKGNPCPCCGEEHFSPSKYCYDCKDTSAYYKKSVLRGMLKRKANMARIIEDFSNKEWLDKLEGTNGYCQGYKCERHYVGVHNLTLDHIVPVSKVPDGFVYTIKDIQPLCKRCNSRKGAKTQ